MEAAEEFGGDDEAGDGGVLFFVGGGGDGGGDLGDLELSGEGFVLVGVDEDGDKMVVDVTDDAVVGEGLGAEFGGVVVAGEVEEDEEWFVLLLGEGAGGGVVVDPSDGAAEVADHDEGDDGEGDEEEEPAATGGLTSGDGRRGGVRGRRLVLGCHGCASKKSKYQGTMLRGNEGEVKGRRQELWDEG